MDLFSDVFTKLEQDVTSDIRSEGMKGFRKLIYEVSHSEEYQNLKREMAATGKNFGYLKSVTIGITWMTICGQRKRGSFRSMRRRFLREVS